MNKALEALERLRNTLLAEGYWQDVLQDVAIIERSLKLLEFLKDTCKIKAYKNKLGQCFLEGTDILYAISQEEYDLLKKGLL